MLSPQPQERKGHRRGMKLGQGIEQPDWKDRDRDSDLLLRVGNPQSYGFLGTHRTTHTHKHRHGYLHTQLHTHRHSCVLSYSQAFIALQTPKVIYRHTQTQSHRLVHTVAQTLMQTWMPMHTVSGMSVLTCTPMRTCTETQSLAWTHPASGYSTTDFRAQQWRHV